MSNSNNLKIENPSWWRRRPRTEKYLLIIVGVLIILILIVLSINFSRKGSPAACKYGSHDICFSSHCIKTAAQILEKVDLNVNPCEDFYKFACGNYINNTVIPDHKTSISALSILVDEVDYNMRNLLKKPITDTDIKPFILAKSLHQACMNTTEIEAYSLLNFQRLIKNTGGWPVTEGIKWSDSDFDWKTTSYKFMEIGFGANMFLNFFVGINVTDSSKKSLFLDQVDFSLDKIKRNGFNESIFQAYYDYMVKVAVVFGAEKASATEEMKAVAELCIAIARITVPAEERRNRTLENNPMTIRELEEKFEYVPWLKYINTMLDPYKKMNYNDVIIVKIPNYYKELEKIFKNTPQRTLANYMYWMIIENHITYLNDELRNLELQFLMTSSGLNQREPRWKECTERVLQQLDIATGVLYVRNTFKIEAKQTLIDMISHIKKQFTETLKTVDWMDAVTKQHALEKINTMHLHMAYPDELLDDQLLEEYYKNLSLNSSGYLQSMLNLSIFYDGITYPELDKPIPNKDWRNHAYVALPQAFYDFTENSIEFVAAILQAVFFDVNKPKYMNYGAIGHFIGHEITHGFDDQGRQYDKNGNLVDWWQPQTKAAFAAKAQCIIDQYSNITIPEVNLNLNGINNQGENIADNGGIKQSYLAYKNWAAKHTPEPVLPGLRYTPEQMFWISVANTWCAVEKTEQLRMNIMDQPHTPSHYRVNVPLMNSEYFSKDFNCPVNSKMNPKHKCTVW